MEDIPSTLDEIRRTGAEYLTVDLSTALTFANIAKTSSVPQTRERNRRNAARAYRSVDELVKKAHLPPDAAETVARLQAELKQRLIELGENL